MPIGFWFWDNIIVMKKTLYIISKPLDDDMKAILSSPLPPAHSISAILIQKGTLVVPSTHIPIFALENDIQKDDILKLIL